VGITQNLLNNHVYYVLRGYTPDRLLVRVNEYGNLVFWDQFLQTDLILTSFEVVPGASFVAYGRECPEDGETQERRVTHDGPAGAWQALEIKYRSFACADAGDLSEQFAENVGMVRRVINTFAGPRTYNLIHARLGNQVITAGNPGSFSVAALPALETNTWAATLRIDPPVFSDLNLHFPSGQEFDARLRDAEGNIVWTWSAGRLFIQAEHTVAVGGGYSASITVPFPPAIPEGSGVYTLEAWMTSAESDPRFAAATVVVVPARSKGGSLATN
jgi:hypothetical protein